MLPSFETIQQDSRAITVARVVAVADLFYVDCDIVNVQKPSRTARVPKLLVDSGSEATWIPESVLKQTGVKVAKKDVPFLMANGQTITRPVGYAIVRAAGFETVDEVVFAQPGDLSLLGARTLEGFGAVVDLRKKKLVMAGPQPAAGAGPPRAEEDDLVR